MPGLFLERLENVETDAVPDGDQESRSDRIAAAMLETGKTNTIRSGIGVGRPIWIWCCL